MITSFTIETQKIIQNVNANLITVYLYGMKHITYILNRYKFTPKDYIKMI